MDAVPAPRRERELRQVQPLGQAALLQPLAQIAERAGQRPLQLLQLPHLSAGGLAPLRGRLAQRAQFRRALVEEARRGPTPAKSASAVAIAAPRARAAAAGSAWAAGLGSGMTASATPRRRHSAAVSVREAASGSAARRSVPSPPADGVDGVLLHQDAIPDAQAHPGRAGRLADDDGDHRHRQESGQPITPARAAASAPDRCRRLETPGVSTRVTTGSSGDPPGAAPAPPCGRPRPPRRRPRSPAMNAAGMPAMRPNPAMIAGSSSPARSPCSSIHSVTRRAR